MKADVKRRRVIFMKQPPRVSRAFIKSLGDNMNYLEGAFSVGQSPTHYDCMMSRAINLNRRGRKRTVPTFHDDEH